MKTYVPLCMHPERTYTNDLIGEKHFRNNCYRGDVKGKADPGTHFC
jgi:hypothetical protein